MALAEVRTKLLGFNTETDSVEDPPKVVSGKKIRIVPEGLRGEDSIAELWCIIFD